MLQPFLLLLIHQRPDHGYELIERLEGMGVTGVEPGHAYRVLRGLERDRLLTSSWVPSDSGPARRRYRLTPEGLSDLRARMASLARFGSVLNSFLTLWRETSQEPPANGGTVDGGTVDGGTVDGGTVDGVPDAAVPRR